MTTAQFICIYCLVCGREASDLTTALQTCEPCRIWEKYVVWLQLKLDIESRRYLEYMVSKLVERVHKMALDSNEFELDMINAARTLESAENFDLAERYWKHAQAARLDKLAQLGRS